LAESAQRSSLSLVLSVEFLDSGVVVRFFARGGPMMVSYDDRTRKRKGSRRTNERREMRSLEAEESSDDEEEESPSTTVVQLVE